MKASARVSARVSVSVGVRVSVGRSEHASVVRVARGRGCVTCSTQ